MEKKHKRIAAVCIFWLALWLAASMTVGNSLLLPSPVETLKTLGELAASRRFYLDAGWTVLRCLVAMGISFVAGALAAACAYRWETVRSVLGFPVGFFKAVPVMAIIIYVILIVRSDWVAVIVCFLMCFPIVYTSILTGLDSVPNEYPEAASLYGLSSGQKIKHIFIPGILPQIKAAISLIAGLSWKAVVAAEVMSIPRYSLGYEMMDSKYYLQTDALFAYIIVIIALSMGFEKLIGYGLGRVEHQGYEGSRIRQHKRFDGRKNGMAPEIVLDDVSKSFDGQDVLSHVSVKLSAGKVTALMGPSGEGKTTLARIATGLEKPYSGTVQKSQSVAFLFQDDRLLPWLNVYDNIAIGRAGDVEPARVKKLTEDLEISQVLWKLPEELSGGMKHRVAMARTFVADCGFIVLDEAFRGLDEPLKRRIIDRLWVRETEGRTVLLITHNREDAHMLADQIIEV